MIKKLKEIFTKENIKEFFENAWIVIEELLEAIALYS